MSRSLLELDEFLVGHWDFENDFKDKSGNGNHGTPTNVEWKPTSRGMKPRLSQSNVSVSDASILGGTLSVSAWVLYENLTDTQFIIYNKDTIGVNRFYLSSDVNTFVAGWRFDDGGSDQRISMPTSSLAPSNIWHHVVAVIDSIGGTHVIYVNGVQKTSTTKTYTIGDIESPLYIGEFNASNYLKGNIDDVRIYSTALDADEVLALYNSTKDGHGVLSYERSYTHRLSPDIDDSTVFASDFSTKNADGTLVDLSGHSNHGTVNGVVRSGGYFTDGLRFDGVDDNIDLNSNIFNGADKLAIEMLIKIEADSKDHALIGWWGANQLLVLFWDNPDGWRIVARDSDGTQLDSGRAGTIDVGKYTYLVGIFDKDVGISILQNAAQITSGDSSGKALATVAEDIFVGKTGTHPALSGQILYCNTVVGDILTTSTIESRFNSLAVLPIYSCEFRSMPSNTTVYTDALPYSSAVINSGSFKLDDGLTCVTDGQLTLRCAHELDGSEYVYTRDDDGKFLSGGTGIATLGTGITVANTDSTAGWTITQSGVNNISLDSDDYRDGVASLIITKLDNVYSEVNIEKAISTTDVTGRAMVVWVYINDSDVYSKLQSVSNQLYLWNGSEHSRWDISKDGLDVGWNKIVLDMDNPTYKSGSSDGTSIDKVRFDFNVNNITDHLEFGDVKMDGLSIYRKASITHGSPMITIDMEAGDTLNDIHINFREEVGCPPLV